MIMEATALKAEFEQRFFVEEDSDREEQLKVETNVQRHEEALKNFTEKSRLKQYWCIPLSVDVRTFNF